LVVLATSGVTLLALAAWWKLSIDAFARTPFGSEAEKVVVLPSGVSMPEVAERLARAGVVSDARKLVWLAQRLDAGRGVRPGEYRFRGALAPTRVLERIGPGRRCMPGEGPAVSPEAPEAPRAAANAPIGLTDPPDGD
jgi:cell division protein YceG involved in septum cleavage